MITGGRMTVGELIEDGARITVSCDWCGAARMARLELILAAKGPDYAMIDRIPLCERPGCLGRMRFRDQRQAVQGWLLSPVGRRLYARHADWVFASDVMIQSGLISITKLRRE